MFLLNFTACSVVDGVPVLSRTSGISVSDDPQDLKLALFMIFTLMSRARGRKGNQAFTSAVDALWHLVDDYWEGLKAQANAAGSPFTTTLPAHTFALRATERFLESTEPDVPAFVDWFFAELHKPVPNHLRLVG